VRQPTAVPRAVRAAALITGTVLAVAACGDGATSTAAPAPTTSRQSGEVAASTSPGATATTAAVLPPCPRLPRAEPRADGLPPLELDCLGEGAPVRLSDLRGVPMVLNVWAAWCTTCNREMPVLAEVQERAGDKLRFFGIHYKAAREYGLRSAADFGVTFPSVHDEDGDRIVSGLRAAAPPQTLFVTADGRVAGRTIGEIRSAAELESLVREHLGVRL
jgi:cytochrome c biogenesis protein CcmG, thiol:disulfide interchange protein DsbE